MKQLIFILSLVAISCTQEEPYFIDTVLTDSVSENVLTVRLETQASNKVDKVEIIYFYRLASGYNTQTIDYINPQLNQVSLFDIERSYDIKSIELTVTDTKGNHKTHKL